jgi:periplasmic protein TonB
MRALARRTDDDREEQPSKRETAPVFRSLAVDTRRPARRSRTFVVTSVVLHVGLLGLLSMHRRAASQQPEVQVRVALVSPSAARSAAATPAARPVEKKTLPKTNQPRLPKPLLAPREIVPVTQTVAPAAEPEPEEAGDQVVGNQQTSAGEQGGGTAVPIVARPPPPPPPPPAPVFQNEANVRRRRVAGHDPAYPAKAERDGVEGVVVAKVVIGPDGRVSDVILMQTHPVFETTVRDAIAGWKFSPLVVNGQAASVYTVFRFTFKLS